MYYHESMKNQTTVEFVKMMDRGMMVIPQMMRNEVGLKKGDYIQVIVRNDEIVLKPYIPTEEISQTKAHKLKIRKPLISKEEGLRILSKRTLEPLWTKEDDAFLKEGRAQIERRLQEYDKI